MGQEWLRVFTHLVGRRHRGPVYTLTSTSIVSRSVGFIHSLGEWSMLTSADMGSKGEIRVNQAKRGYDVAEDEAGLSWINP